MLSISPPIYIYLEPELNQSSLFAVSVLFFPIGILIFLYYYYKRRWETNKCDGDLAYLAPLFGMTTNDWAKRCLHAPLEGTIFDLKDKIDKLTKEVTRTSVFEPALNIASNQFMQISTKLSTIRKNLVTSGPPNTTIKNRQYNKKNRQYNKKK